MRRAHSLSTTTRRSEDRPRFRLRRCGSHRHTPAVGNSKNRTPECQHGPSRQDGCPYHHHSTPSRRPQTSSCRPERSRRRASSVLRRWANRQCVLTNRSPSNLHCDTENEPLRWCYQHRPTADPVRADKTQFHKACSSRLQRSLSAPACRQLSFLGRHECVPNHSQPEKCRHSEPCAAIEGCRVRWRKVLP